MAEKVIHFQFPRFNEKFVCGQDRGDFVFRPREWTKVTCQGCRMEMPMDARGRREYRVPEDVSARDRAFLAEDALRYRPASGHGVENEADPVPVEGSEKIMAQNAAQAVFVPSEHVDHMQTLLMLLGELEKARAEAMEADREYEKAFQRRDIAQNALRVAIERINQLTSALINE